MRAALARLHDIKGPLSHYPESAISLVALAVVAMAYKGYAGTILLPSQVMLATDSVTSDAVVLYDSDVGNPHARVPLCNYATRRASLTVWRPDKRYQLAGRI